MNITNYLSQPFPKAEKKWKIIILISLFVALFLIIFQPFDINLFKDNNKYAILSGYGFITFCALVINLILIENIFKGFFDERNWKLWKEFVWLLWIICSIGFGNALYTSMVFDFHFDVNVSFFINFQIITFIVASIPITILIVSKQKYLFNKNTNSASDLNQLIESGKKESKKVKPIRFYSENEKDSIEFEIDDFFFIESSGNYIELCISDHGKIIKKIFRSTLKRSLDFFIDSPKIIQCHRAFIVNTNKIVNVKGNSQGLRLSLKNCETEVPVSRAFVDSVRKILK